MRPNFSSSNHKPAGCQSPTGLTRTMSGKEPDQTLSAGSFLFSVSSHEAHGLVLREANHIQAHAEEQVQPRCSGRAAAPSPPSSQACRSRLPAPRFSDYTGRWWRGHHTTADVGQHRHPSSPTSSRMLIEGAGLHSTRGQKCRP